MGRRELGLSRLETTELRHRLNALNRGIADLAAEHDFLLGDIERLFHGHGVGSDDTWFVQVIEPNLAGATAIAENWCELLTSSKQDLSWLRRSQPNRSTTSNRGWSALP